MAFQSEERSSWGEPAEVRSGGVPIRVVYGLLEFPVLSETFIVREMAGLVRAGHDVHVATFRLENSEMSRALVEPLGLLKRTIHIDIPERPVSRLVRFPETLARCMKRHGARTALRALTEGRDSTSLRPLFEAAAFPAGSRFDIAHCHFGPAGFHGLRWKRAGLASRLVVTFHANDLVGPVRIHSRAYYEPLFAEADLLLAISEFGRRRLLDLGAPGDRIAIQPCPIALSDRASADLRRKPGQFHVLSVGRLVEKKGLDDAIACLDLVARRQPELSIRHTIIGSGPLEEQLRNRASRVRNNLEVALLGARSPAEVERHLRETDLFLLPSRTAHDGDEEGLPVALMEAMGLGLPVVSTIHTGIPELIRHRKTGLLAREGDVETLADLVEEVLENPGLAARLGSAARKTVLARHDIRKTTAVLLEHYRRIL